MDERAQAMLVVVLLSHQDVDTIGLVTAAVRDGLARNFDGLAGKIVLVDCGSSDGTVARARDTLGGDNLLELPQVRPSADVLQVPYHGLPGKARALQATLVKVRDLGASACIILDASVGTVTPQWVEWLARPVVQHAFDFVSRTTDGIPLRAPSPRESSIRWSAHSTACACANLRPPSSPAPGGSLTIFSIRICGGETGPRSGSTSG